MPTGIGGTLYVRHNNQNHPINNKYSRTFTNSITLPTRSSQTRHEHFTSRQNFHRNMTVSSRNNNRWCSFCSSATHDWLYCYSNPNGLNYDPEKGRYLQQQQSCPQPKLLPHYSQQYHQQNTKRATASSIPTFDAKNHLGQSAIEEQPIPTSISSHNLPSLSSSEPLITSSQALSSTSITTDPYTNLDTPIASSTSPTASNDINSDTQSSFFNDIKPGSSSASYLIAEAKINGIRGVVLLDTGSGRTTISSQHWSIIGDKSIRPTPYIGPDIKGPEKASLAKRFTHFILIGNDFMKTNGLVLDIQANKMWIRSMPDLKYDISSDIINAGHIDIPLISTQRRSIPPYHVASIQVKTPPSVLSDAWEASVSGIRRHVIDANSLVRIKNQGCLIQVINCSSKSQVIYPGQYLAIADLYDDDVNNSNCVLPLLSTSTSLFNITDFSRRINCYNKFDQSPQNKNRSFNNSTDINQQNIQLSNYVQLNSPNLQASIILSLHSSPKPDTLFTEQKDTSTAKLYDLLADLNLSDTDLTINESEQLKLLLVKYYKCFEDQLGRTSLIQHHIDTGNTKSIKLRPYRVSPARKEIISTEITKMINAGIIEPCNSPYAVPITLQPKKNGTLRFCIDFRELNVVTVRDVYPIPRIDDTLDQLQHANYFTSMDLRSGFWQIELDSASRDKTAFICHAGLFRFRVMPF
ncbi:unnamed protein product, partial [Rotaria socialis]